MKTPLQEKMPLIDIVMTHKNRLDYLKQTLKALWERTKSDYTLSIIDDGSDDGSREYLWELFKKKKLKTLLLKQKTEGYLPAINDIVETSNSDFFVFMTDDTILPDIEPDWLQTMWQEFDWLLDLGMLGLNNPTADLHTVFTKYEKIHIIDQINSNVIMLRRDSFSKIPEIEGIFNEMLPLSVNCINANRKIAYMPDVYTLHIGRKTSLPNFYLNDEYDPKTFIEVNPKTLKPKELNARMDK